MELSNSNIKRRSQELAGFVKEYWVIAVILLFVAAFAFVQIQRYFDRRAIEIQNRKITDYDADRQRSAEQTQMLQNIFDQQHSATLKILDAMNSMSGTINKLTESDLRQDRIVQNLREEYQSARNPNLQTKTNSAVRAARAALPVPEREQRALSTDAELYPGADGN